MYLLSKKRKRNEIQQYENVDLTSSSPNHELRSFFIDTTIKTINYMNNKVFNGRVRDVEREKIKIQQLKLIINACNVGNRVLKDRQLDDYEKEMNELKNGLIFDVSSGDVIEISPESMHELDELDNKLAKIKEDDKK